MRTYHRTPQQRDRRFARVRRMTQTVLIGSGVASGVFVGYAASTAKPVSTVRVPTGTTQSTSSGAATPTTTVPASGASQSPSTVYTPPTTAPVTTTTACYTTPSGTTVCY